MSNLQKILKEQEEEFGKKLIEFSDDVITVGFGGDELNGYKGKFNKEAEFLRTKDYREAKNRLKSFIQFYNAKIIKAICEEKAVEIKEWREKYNKNKFGNNINYDQGINDGLNQAQSIIKNLCTEKNQNL